MLGQPEETVDAEEALGVPGGNIHTFALAENQTDRRVGPIQRGQRNPRRDQPKPGLVLQVEVVHFIRPSFE
eukprot:11179118-Lingulodinium_polyedra.AAC.1